MAGTALDRMKLAAVVVSLLNDYSEARATIRERAKTIESDTTRTQAWRNAELAKNQATWAKAEPGLRKPMEQAIERFEREDSMLKDPIIQTFSIKAQGAANAVEDAALKAEFRALMQTLPTTSRREWFSMLAEDGDLGRIGVLVSLEPSLVEDARALSIPGRDEALAIAAKIRAELKRFRDQERQDRWVELEASPNLTQSQTIEMIRIADQLEQDQNSAQEVAKSTFTDAEQARYAELKLKGDAGQLTKGEGVELIALADKAHRKMQAELEAKV